MLEFSNPAPLAPPAFCLRIMPRVAVLGAGITGSFFVKTLLDACKNSSKPALQRLTVDVFEGGRGSGGRCSSRKSTEERLGPSGLDMAITHGTPAFDAKSEQFRDIAEDLVHQGLLERWDDCRMGIVEVGEKGVPKGESVDAHNVFHVPPNTHTLYRGRPETNRMEGVCDVLLEGATLRPKILVSRIEPASTSSALAPSLRSASGSASSGSALSASTLPSWELFGREGESLGEYDWVVVTGTTAASDRWRAAFQTEPPLQQLLPTLDAAAAAGPGDGSDDAAYAAASAAVAIRALKAVQSRPVLTMMTVLTGEAMERWNAAFPFDLAHVEGSAIIKKVVRQAGNPKCLPVIVHSTPEYAEAQAAGGVQVHGKHSSMAAIIGDPAAEAAAKTEAILSAMQAELAACVAPWPVGTTTDTDVLGFNDAAYGPLLHRWGAAFPDQQPEGSVFREEFPRVIPGAYRYRCEHEHEHDYACVRARVSLCVCVRARARVCVSSRVQHHLVTTRRVCVLGAGWNYLFYLHADTAHEILFC